MNRKTTLLTTLFLCFILSAFGQYDDIYFNPKDKVNHQINNNRSYSSSDDDSYYEDAADEDEELMYVENNYYYYEDAYYTSNMRYLDYYGTPYYFGWDLSFNDYY